MAISAAGQALAQKNKANRQQFAQATAMPKTTGVTPEAQANLDILNTRANGDAIGDMSKFGNPNAPKVTDKFTKENFLKMSGTTPTSTPTPLGTTNTSAGLNIVGAPHPSSIIQPGNTTGELPNTTITQTSGQTGRSSPFATGNGSIIAPTPKPTSTVGADVATSIQDGIKQNQDAIKAEQDQLAKVKAANDAAISTKSTTTNDQVAGENAYANGMLSVNTQRMSDLNLSNAEYASEQERQKNQTLTTVQPLIDKERADNYAMLTEAKVKADNAEYNMEVQNDAALAQQNMAYASMGMTFTPSAINATRRLSTESSMKIAELKAGNAYKYAGLAKEMNKTEVAHQLMVNKIIADANDNILTKREKTRKDITDVQSNILLTEKEKVDKIAKLKNEYSTFRASTENLTLTQVRDSNKEVERRLNDITTKLDKDKTDAKQELVSLIKNGQWDKLSPQNKNKISKRSGLSLGEIEGEKTSSLYTTVNAGIQALIGKDFVVTPESSKKVYDLATSYIAMGDSVFVATQKAIKALAPTLKEFNESQTYQRDTRASKLATEKMNRDATSVAIQNAKQDLYEKVMTSSNRIKASNATYVRTEKDSKGTWTSTTTPDENGFILQSNKDGEIRYVEPKLQKTAEEWAATSGIDLLRAPDGTRVPGTRNPRTDGGSECGEFANDVTGSIVGPDGKYPETAKARDAAFQDTTPVAGAQAFFSGGKYDKTYGHVAIVTNVNRDKDGNVVSFDVQESNLKGDGKVGTRTNIPVSEAKFYNKTELGIQAGNKKAFYSLDDMQSSPAKAIREVLAENPIDITKSGVNFQELQKVMGEVAKNYKDDKVSAKSALVQLLTTQGLIEEKYDIKDKEGTIKKLVDNKRIPVDKVGNKLREMGIQEGKFDIPLPYLGNEYGSYYTDTDSKGNIKLFKSGLGSDEVVAEFKAGS